MCIRFWNCATTHLLALLVVLLMGLVNGVWATCNTFELDQESGNVKRGAYVDDRSPWGNNNFIAQGEGAKILWGDLTLLDEFRVTKGKIYRSDSRFFEGECQPGGQTLFERKLTASHTS
jgi:hypothetical protein